MPDVTTVSHKARQYLLSLGYDFVDFGEFMFSNNEWSALVLHGDMIRGTVVLDSAGNVLKEKSFPQVGIDKR